MSDLEVRTYLAPVEFRAAADGKPAVASGYGYVFNSRSQDLGGFFELVAPGAGARSLEEDDVVALANHDKNLLLGRQSAGTLRAAEDDNGSAYEIDLPDTSAGRDWAVSLERRDVIGSSFGFRTNVDGVEWRTGADGAPERILHSFSVRDLGPVTFPAYLKTEAALRSLADATDADVEDVLAAARDNTLTRFLPDHPAPVVFFSSAVRHRRIAL